MPEVSPAASPSSRLLPADLELNELERKNSKSSRLSMQQAPREALHNLVHSWFSRKFASGCAILFPVAVTCYITWWFLTFFDGVFSPIYMHFLGVEIFGLGFLTSMSFILATGVFCSSWVGETFIALGEWIIKRLPLIKHIYSASKQVSAAINPDSEGTRAFQECVLIKHPRNGTYAFGFITGKTLLSTSEGDTRLNCIYVPTNHIYVGDIFLLKDEDVIHTNLSVREGIEIVVSVGMAVPADLRQLKAR